LSFSRTTDEKSWLKFEDYHRGALKRLEANGADFAVIASITPHHRLSTIVQGIGIPVINIIEEVAVECSWMGVRSVVLLGTDLTMRSVKFSKVFAERGIDTSGPAARRETIDLI